MKECILQTLSEKQTISEDDFPFDFLTCILQINLNKKGKYYERKNNRN